MNRYLSLAVVSAISLTTLGAAQASPTPTQVVNAFYQSVVAPTSQNAPCSHPDHTQLSQALSQQLLRVENLPLEYTLDFDPWGGAQVGLDRFAVIQGLTSGEKSRIDVKVHRCGCDSAIVNVFLIQEDGAWKIDNIVVPRDNTDLRHVLNVLLEGYSRQLEK